MRGAPAAAARVAEADFDGLLYSITTPLEGLNFTAERRLRNGAKTKAGPLEAEQLSRLGNNTYLSGNGSPLTNPEK